MAWYDYIYNHNDLMIAQSFESDQKLVKSGKKPKNNWVKQAATLAIWCTFINSFRA